MSRYLSLAVFLVLVVGGGSLIGMWSIPGEWYAGLVKPSFNPPNWIFAPVWTILYIMIAIAGWRTWEQRSQSTAMRAWFTQLALNFMWSPAFFVLQMPTLALVIIILVLIAIIWFLRLTWNKDRPSALLFLPYLAWVSFATLLNASIVWLN